MEGRMMILKTFVRAGLYSIVFILDILATTASSHQWVQTYTHTLTQCEQIKAGKKNIYTTGTQETLPFTQLIFSWNARRPIKGYYAFSIQARDMQTGIWSSWHKAIEWGKNKQLSFLSGSDGIAHYAHVRFEVCAGKKCNAYRVRVQAYDGALLSGLYSLTVTGADYTSFRAESVRDHTSLTTVCIDHVPRRSQFALIHKEKERLCSPTSCAMLVEFITGKRCAMNQFAQNVFDKNLDTYGNWPFNIAHSFELSNGKVGYSVVRLNSFKELYAYLLKGNPAVVSVRGPLVGAPKPYANGHLLVVIGYDAQKKKVICHDPAFKRDNSIVHSYDLASFLRAWECSRRLVYRIDMHS